MSRFRLYDKVPDVYVNESRDFQLLLRLYEATFCGLKYDIDTIKYITETSHIRNTFLPLLSTKLGFFTDIEIDDKSLRLILEALPYFLKYKGSLLGVKQVINLYLKIMNSTASVLISYASEATESIPDHSIQIGADITFTNLPLLNALLELVLPIGFNQYYYQFVSLNSALNTIEQSNEIVLLGKIISYSQSKLRHQASEYDWVDSDYDIRLPTASDDELVIVETKNNLVGAASIMQIAGSNDDIPEFSTSSTYHVGDVVSYSTHGYYQCIVAVTQAGAWNDANWEQLTYL